MDCDGVRRSSVNWRGCMVTYFAFNDFICCINKVLSIIISV